MLRGFYHLLHLLVYLHPTNHQKINDSVAQTEGNTLLLNLGTKILIFYSIILKNKIISLFFLIV